MDVSSLPSPSNPFVTLDTELVDLLFDRVPLGMALFDGQFRLIRCNPAWAAQLERFTSTPAQAAAPGKSMFELMPGSEALIQPVWAQVLRGETARADNVRAESGGVVSYWNGVFTPVLKNDQVVAVLEVVVDVTAQVEAYQKLQESEFAVRSMVENAQHVAVYRVAFNPHDPLGGKLVFVSPSLQDIVGGSTAEDFASWFENLHPDDVERVMVANKRSVEQGVPYNEVTRVFHKAKNQWVWVHTISNPFFDAAGRLTYFDGMVIDITDQMHLREVERLHQAAEGLREIIAIINSNHSLQEILDFIARQANELMNASSTMIRRVYVRDGVERVRTVASCYLPPDFDPIWDTELAYDKDDKALLTHQPSVTENVPEVVSAYLHAYDDLSDYEKNGLLATMKHYQAMVKVPLFVRDTIFGSLTFHFEQPRAFRQEDLHLATTLANQAALAIENARLIDQVKEQAVVEERSRLARELHDAVTQTLFSTTLTAEVLPRIWERNPTEGRKKLDELRELTRGALAEMRTLLMELRPDALADAELKDLLRHLTNAFIARARVPVQLVFDGHPQLPGQLQLPLDVKIVFYRIAQEALNNTAKYAEANQVTLSLTCSDEQIELSIADDGLGFDPDQALSTDHFGLRIMHERAAQVGAALTITSRPEAGTCINVLWRSPSLTDPTPEEV